MDLLALKRSLMPMSGPQDMGGGGGGSSTGTSTQISELPEWARGYAKSALEKGAALSEKPYQAYDAPRIAGFSPMQLQAQQGAAEMQTSGLTGLGGQVAGEAAMRGLGQNYDAGQFQGGRFGGREAAQYMSPFIQEALAPQLREAQRSSDILGQQNAARAVGQGAFGGSRSALVEAERQRNLGMQMGDIRAKGLQDAYTQAANQFNADQARSIQAQQLGEQSRQFGANLGLQGLNTALQGAGQLGALGGQEFQQGMDINKLQSAYGGQQQALRQQGLTQAYEDFQNQQNYPYKQLGFFSDMIRGLPLGQMTTRSMYEPAPNAAQQVGALGMGAYGLSKFMAEGGMAYADGGSVDAPDNVERIVSKLSDQQLQQAAQAAQARGDMDQLEAIQSEMAMRASERKGIAAGITPQIADRMAGGGVVAFKEPTAANNYSLTDSEEDEDGARGERSIYFPGNKKGYDLATQRWLESDEAISKYRPSKALTAEDRAAMDEENFKRFQKFAGADPYAPMAERLKGFEADRAKSLEEGKGLAALQAIPAMLQGRGIRGIAGGIGALGGNLAQVAKADAAEKRALASMDFNLADAQRKERMGLTRDAIASTTEAQKDKIAADKAQLESLKARSKSATDAIRVFRPIGTGGAGAGGAGKLPQVDRETAALQDKLIDLKATPGANPAQVKALEDKIEARMKIIAATKDVGPEKAAAAAATTAVTTTRDAEKAWNDLSRKEKRQFARDNGVDVYDAKQKYLDNYATRAQPNKAAGAAPSKVTPIAVPRTIPANATPDMLENGALYDTANGPATWNAKTQKFVMQ